MKRSKNWRCKFMFLLALSFLSTTLFAQQIQVTGTITDDKKSPLQNVAVSVKNGTAGTLTDAQGKFTISVQPNSMLLISYVGFAEQEITITYAGVYDIELKALDKNLDEVVVIGYGTQKKKELTSAIATVKSEDFVKAPVLDAGQLLQGKVAGLTISTPSGDPASGSQILLRGNTTLVGANANPLVLIDGIPGDLKLVAPEDIESIDVLKDGSAAAIYGTRGTNGVIIVTTRRPGGREINTVDYSTSLSTQSIVRKLEMLTAADYRKQIADGTRDASWDKGHNTNWLDETTQAPFTQVHNLTFRGGNSRTNYLANVNYRYLEGIFVKSDNRTFNGRIEVNHSMFDNKLKFNVGILNTQNRVTTTGDGMSFNGYTYRQALIYNPTAPLRGNDGRWFEEPGQFNYENPLARLHESNGRNMSQTSRYNANITYLPFRGLQLNALLSYTKYNQTRGYSETKNHISTRRDNRNGYASVGNGQNENKLLELTAQYSKNTSGHNFTVLGGYGYQEDLNQDSWMQNWNFPTDIFGYNNIGIGKALTEGLAPMSSSRFVTNLISFFGRATYAYQDKYLLMASLRHEAASQLYGTNKPWGTFPSVSAGWRISNENFMANSIFTDLKLRAGYGVTGSQPNSIFLGLGTLSYSGWFYTNGQWINNLLPSRNPNPHLRWEEKRESNFGVDFDIKNGLVSGSIDYYIRNIDGLLYDFAVPVPPNTYGSTRANVGKMQNKGVEAIVNFKVLDKKDFSWITSVNFSTNSNRLVTLSNDLYQFSGNFFTTGYTGEPIQTYTHRVNIGGPIGDFFGFKVIDVTDDGKWIYEDEEGKAVAHGDFQHRVEDKKILGNGLPQYYAGWNNNIRYKNFDLGITMRGAFKYQILNFQRMYYENTNIQQYNRLQSAYEPLFGKAVLNKDVPLEFNSHYVENGDFWKIDNIVLGYNIPVGTNKYIKSARVFLSTLNTFIITGYKGIDPEVNRLGLNPGVDDRDKFPAVRTYTLGANFSF